MGLLDTLTGGKNKAAEEALKRAEAAFSGIDVPTAAQLTLPELQKYVQAGILTPEQAKTALIQGNAYQDIKMDPASIMAEQDSLNKLKGVSEAGGMTPQMQAQLTAALDKVATETRGNNAAITDQFSQRGIPASLMAEASMKQEAGDSARTAALTGTQAAGQAEQNAINAMMNEGNLASSMHGQQYSEQANKAAAENAMRQWNAGATNTTAEANANRATEANRMNLENAQNVSNQNTSDVNKRTAYNANIPETIFGNKVTKASGQAGVNRDQSNMYGNQGNQILGLIGAGVGATANAFAPGAGGAPKPPAGYNPNMSYDMLPAAEGAVVPGTPEVPGDSPRNDKVHAMLSPGELVIPRSVAPDPDAVKRFAQHLLYNKKPSAPVTPAHPDDIHSILEALTKRRTQNIHTDGKDFEFTPGENGSLVTKGKPPTPFIPPPPEKRARVIMPTPTQDVMTGSTRG